LGQFSRLWWSKKKKKRAGVCLQRTSWQGRRVEEEVERRDGRWC
jgi:hypothetical protein